MTISVETLYYAIEHCRTNISDPVIVGATYICIKAKCPIYVTLHKQNLLVSI